MNPSFMDSFKKTHNYLKETQSLLDDYILEVEDRVIESINGDQISYKINQIQSLNNPKAYLYHLLKPYGFTDWNEITLLLEAQTGKQISSPTHRLIKNRQQLILSKLETPLPVFISIDSSQTVVEIPGHSIALIMELTNSKVSTSTDVIQLDFESLKFPLTLRQWNEGDYFYPTGMQGKKKLSKFFKDEKLSLIDKEKVLILCSDDQVVWIVGKRADNRFMVTDQKGEFIKISIEVNAYS
tara:strand:- start:95 stop:814 length:720 start_codon:yes stop_codon:yes gene_type:complete